MTMRVRWLTGIFLTVAVLFSASAARPHRFLIGSGANFASLFAQLQCTSDSQCNDSNVCTIDFCASDNNISWCDYSWIPGCCGHSDECLWPNPVCSPVLHTCVSNGWECRTDADNDCEFISPSNECKEIKCRNHQCTEVDKPANQLPPSCRPSSSSSSSASLSPSSSSNPSTQGKCCHADGSESYGTQQQCTNGTWHSETWFVCPTSPTQGTCCFPNGSSTTGTQQQCTNGTWHAGSFVCPTSPSGYNCTTLNCNDNNPCTLDGCNTRTGCTHQPKANCCRNDSQCSACQRCGGNNTCVQRGACCPGDACPAPDACHTAQCDPNTFQCVPEEKSNCCIGDGQCETCETCVQNTCTRIGQCCSPSECPEPSDECHIATCEGNECGEEELPDSQKPFSCFTSSEDSSSPTTTTPSCDDDNICTTDAIRGGKCTHTPIAGCCRTPDECGVPCKTCAGNKCVKRGQCCTRADCTKATDPCFETICREDYKCVPQELPESKQPDSCKTEGTCCHADGSGTAETQQSCKSGVWYEDSGHNCSSSPEDSSSSSEDSSEDDAYAECGNGIVEDGEECDAGEWNDTDQTDCTAFCTIGECGNGISDEYSRTSKGTIEKEACDDGTMNSDAPEATCSTDCKLLQCGDGKIDPGEECDNGKASTEDPEAQSIAHDRNVCSDQSVCSNDGIVNVPNFPQVAYEADRPWSDAWQTIIENQQNTCNSQCKLTACSKADVSKKDNSSCLSDFTEAGQDKPSCVPFSGSYDDAGFFVFDSSESDPSQPQYTGGCPLLYGYDRAFDALTGLKIYSTLPDSSGESQYTTSIRRFFASFFDNILLAFLTFSQPRAHQSTLTLTANILLADAFPFGKPQLPTDVQTENRPSCAGDRCDLSLQRKGKTCIDNEDCTKPDNNGAGSVCEGAEMGTCRDPITQEDVEIACDGHNRCGEHNGNKMYCDGAKTGKCTASDEECCENTKCTTEALSNWQTPIGGGGYTCRQGKTLKPKKAKLDLGDMRNDQGGGGGGGGGGRGGRGGGGGGGGGGGNYRETTVTTRTPGGTGAAGSKGSSQKSAASSAAGNNGSSSGQLPFGSSQGNALSNVSSGGSAPVNYYNNYYNYYGVQPGSAGSQGTSGASAYSQTSQNRSNVSYPAYSSRAYSSMQWSTWSGNSVPWDYSSQGTSDWPWSSQQSNASWPWSSAPWNSSASSVQPGSSQGSAWSWPQSSIPGSSASAWYSSWQYSSPQWWSSGASRFSVIRSYGYSAASSASLVITRFPSMYCSNGKPEAGEQCDDGNLHDGDGCDRFCRREIVGTCGNGKTEPPEECDDGNATAGDGCSTFCKRETGGGGWCGNRRLDPGEQCDDGNMNVDDGCDALCNLEESVPPTCGNGRPDAWEECDDGNRIGGDGCSVACRTEPPAGPPLCGNGVTDVNEQCDDGNYVLGDGCDPYCRREPRVVLPLSPLCGNGVLNAGEECDDGNLRELDGCSATCFLERGRCGDEVVQRALGEECEPSLVLPDNPFRCESDCKLRKEYCGNGILDVGEECDHGRENSRSPDALCRPTCSYSRCGDGITDRMEQCDDGNSVPGDGCNAFCMREWGAAASLSPWATSAGTNPNLALLSPLNPLRSHAPIGNTGPATVAIMSAGAAAGLAWIRRRKRK